MLSWEKTETVSAKVSHVCMSRQNMAEVKVNRVYKMTKSEIQYIHESRNMKTVMAFQILTASM